MPHGNSAFARALRRGGVSESPEFLRISNLERRKLLIEKDAVYTERDGIKKVIPDLTAQLKTSNGSLKLWPLQNALLWEAYHANGGLGLISVGGGKTLVALLLPLIMGSQRAVILVKPQLKEQLIRRDVPNYVKHFKLPLNRIRVVAYTELSSAGKASILKQIRPDLIVADECHSLRNRSSARTKRFLRYMRENPETRFVGLSGTIAKRSIMDYAHLAELALKKNSPLPLNYPVLEEWSEAIDAVADEARPPGVLLRFCEGDENVREGFRRRVRETTGVVASEEGSIGTSLNILVRKLTKPKIVDDELKKLYTTWQIGEEELPDAMALMRVARQLACGFYYKWKWPNGQRDEEWITARRAWHKAVRTYLLHNSKDGLDSPLLLARAAMDGRWQCDAWSGWDAVRSRQEPETLPMWLSDFLVTDAIKWGRERLKAKENGIIFYEHDCIGQGIAKFGPFPIYGADADASSSNPTKEPIIVCSIKAQGEGKNLQAWNNMLITTPPANGLSWEQILGREHRPGQLADEVNCWFYMFCDEFKKAWEASIKDAEFIEQTQGQKQKLLYATKVLE